jgi:tetratricopeptide (TPR) repeat protein
MFKIKLLVITLAVAMLTGCNTYEQKKEAASMRWEKATAKAKVTVAEEFLRNNRFLEAEKTLAKAIVSDPQLASAHLLMGKLQFAQAKIALAEKSLVTAIELDENMHQGWYFKGLIDQQNKKLADALANYKKAMDIQPDNIEYIAAVVQMHAAGDDYQKAIELLESKIQLLPGKSELRLAKAEILLRLGELSGAIEMYNTVLLLEGDDPGVIESLGYCYIMDKQFSNAADIFEKLTVASTGEKKKTYLQLLAMCSMNAGQYGRAVGYYDQISPDKRDDAQMWLQMGQAALGANVPARAMACSSRALELRPGWGEAIVLHGCAQYLNDDYNTAIETFRRVISNNKNAGFAWLMTGRCYQQLGQEQLARKAYDNAARLSPDSKLVSLLTDEKK